MPEEMVAVYAPDDDSGRVVGAVPRSRMRAENLPHAATAVLLVDGEGRVYVHRRTDDKDVYPGMWDCWAGGVVTAGEHPDAAAARELTEELGVRVSRLEPLFRQWYRDDRTWYLAWCYRARWQGESVNGPVVHQPEEVAEGAWATLGELRALLADPARPFVPDGRAGIERYLAECLGDHLPQRPAQGPARGSAPGQGAVVPGGPPSRPEARGTPPSGVGRVPAAVAAALDTSAVLLFAAVGRRSHAEGLAVVGVLRTAWPFLAGAALGWLVARRRRTPAASLAAGVRVWAGALVVGMLLRVLTGAGTAASFVVVAAVALAVVLLGWRLVARAVRAGAVRARRPEVATPGRRS